MSELEEMKKEITYLRNSHHVLIKSLQDNNNGLIEMNILIRGLIHTIVEQGKNNIDE